MRIEIYVQKRDPSKAILINPNTCHMQTTPTPVTTGALMEFALNPRDRDLLSVGCIAAIRDGLKGQYKSIDLRIGGAA